MKQFLFILAFLILSFHAKTQVATSGCTTVSHTAPNYPPNLFSSFSGQIKNCIATNCGLVPQLPLEAKNWLEKENSDGTFSTVQGPINGRTVTFNNVTPGKYKVHSQIPILNDFNGECPNGVKLFNCIGQQVGMIGRFDPGTTIGGGPGIPPIITLGKGHYVSNEVFVGAAQTSDIQWSYIDGDGLDAGTNLFDFNEVVRINTAGTQNYTHWWLAIFELNGAMRYKSTGWNFGAMPTTINLSSFWGENAWVFENLTSYRVQLAISNQCNTQWTEMSPAPPDFFICPQGSGCRPGGEIVPITLAPNPATYQFSLQNLPNSDVQVHVYDMSGRLVKNYQNTYGGSFDISDVNNGIYIIRAVQDGEILYNGKLSVVH